MFLVFCFVLFLVIPVRTVVCCCVVAYGFLLCGWRFCKVKTNLSQETKLLSYLCASFVLFVFLRCVCFFFMWYSWRFPRWRLTLAWTRPTSSSQRRPPSGKRFVMKLWGHGRCEVRGLSWSHEIVNNVDFVVVVRLQGGTPWSHERCNVVTVVVAHLEGGLSWRCERCKVSCCSSRGRFVTNDGRLSWLLFIAEKVRQVELYHQRR